MQNMFPKAHAKLSTDEGLAAVQFSARRCDVTLEDADAALEFVVDRVFGDLPAPKTERDRQSWEMALLLALGYAERATAKRLRPWTMTTLRSFARKTLVA